MSVRVVARIRPLLKNELDRDVVVSAIDAGGEKSDKTANVVRIPNPKNEGENFNFQFNSVYGSEATQQDLYESEVAPTVKHLFNGFDITLFAYGVTGTGKTHTMRGGKTLAERGVIPRLLSGIYRRSQKIEKDSGGETSITITMSYYEIYNDRVFDLFESPEKRTMSGLQLRDNGGKTVVVGLTERPCETLKEFEKLYDQANVNRSTGATKLNAHSSRSHAILCVKVTIQKGDETRVSTASAIDLAGSEDNRRTENGKERLVESASINKSLFVLAQCVEAISKKQNRIPYRESKMTRILSLGQNNGLTVMILNLAPVRSYHLDTLSSLNFANRTKKIEIREVENEPIFKGCSRPVVASVMGAAIQRQPLRPIATAVHNSKVHAAGHNDNPTKSDKPLKAFAVFSDSGKPSYAPSTAQKRRSDASKKHSPLKRSSEHVSSKARPSKISRPSPATGSPRTHQISKATIEDLVEKKVSEILASRALDQPSMMSTTPDISDEMRQRLELLEQKIEGKEDGRSEGLTFLLMAKQHYVRGEEQSALKMYELAQDSFPDNTKLRNKIERLRVSVREKKEALRDTTSTAGGRQSPPPKSIARVVRDPSRKVDPSQKATASEWEPNRKICDKLGVIHLSSDDEYDPLQQDHIGDDDDPDYDSQARGSPRRPPPKPSTALRRANLPHTIKLSHTRPASHPSPASQTPRTKQLLSIINTRDVTQIRLLRGVGAKKAEAIIAALCAGEGDEDEDEDDDETDQGGVQVQGEKDRVVIQDLGQLGRLKGVGVKTVENMRMGLGGVVLGD
ncbi:hypothetical protein MMC25_001396 [Agyrium rufum]|nr:hypothetical protein [Agyrium rufum]